MLHVVRKVALMTSTAEMPNSKQGRVWQVCNFTECDAVQPGAVLHLRTPQSYYSPLKETQSKRFKTPQR